MTTTAAPTLDPGAALDRLLDARLALLTVQQMSPEGAPLFRAMAGSLAGTDEALRLVRAIGKAT